MNKHQLLSSLDTLLETAKRQPYDRSKNGLQVDTSRSEIKKIGYAVDTTSYIIDKAIQAGVDLMITHHGLYWGLDTPLTGMMYERVKKLIEADIGLYASHLPLDAHMQVGNNIGMLQAWQRCYGIPGESIPFGSYKGLSIGRILQCETSLPFASLLTFVEALGLERKLLRFGNEEIKRIAFCSGSGGGVISEAIASGVDLLVTGELEHHWITLAKESGLNLILGGHYETEKIGVKLLCYHLKKQYEGLEVVFLDEKW